MPLKHKWKTDSSAKITETLNIPKFNDRIDAILHKCYDDSSEGSKSFNNDVTTFIKDLADETLVKSKGLPNRFKKRWFDAECLVSKRNLTKLVKKSRSIAMWNNFQKIITTKKRSTQSF